jgi:general secretion pathway protein C
MGSARLVPQRRDDQRVGVKLSGIDEGSTYHRLGFREGDMIVEVAGYPIHDPQKALEAYAKLRNAERVDVKVQRGDETVMLRYDIESTKP